MVFKTTVGLKQGNKGFHVFLRGEGIRTKYLTIGYLDPLGNIASTISVPEACFRQRGFLLAALSKNRLCYSGSFHEPPYQTHTGTPGIQMGLWCLTLARYYR